MKAQNMARQFRAKNLLWKEEGNFETYVFQRKSKFAKRLTEF